jgi:hypothetical protein
MNAAKTRGGVTDGHAEDTLRRVQPSVDVIDAR